MINSPVKDVDISGEMKNFIDSMTLEDLEYFIDKSPFTDRLKGLALFELGEFSKKNMGDRLKFDIMNSLSKVLSGDEKSKSSKSNLGKSKIDEFIGRMTLEDWEYFIDNSLFSEKILESMKRQVWIHFFDKKGSGNCEESFIPLELLDLSDDEIKRINNLTEYEQLKLLQERPYFLQFIENPSEALQIRAIEIDPYTFFCIKKPSTMIKNLFGGKVRSIEYDVIKIVEYGIADFNVKKQILSVFNDSEFNLGHFNYLNSISQYLDDVFYNGQELWFHYYIDIADEYLKKYLEQIGHGRDRAIYALDDDKVIKWRGARQNRGEFESYNDLSGSSIFPKIFGHGENFRWIVSERVMPISYWDFLKILHMPFDGGDLSKVKLQQRRPYQKLEQSKFGKFYHEYIKRDQRKLEMKDRQNYSSATENNERDDHGDYVEYSINNPIIHEKIKECLKEGVIDNDTGELIEIADYESIYPEGVCLREFINVMQNYYVVRDIEKKGIPTDHGHSMYKLYVQAKKFLDNVDKERFVIYKKLAKYDMRFNKLVEYIKYRPYTCDLHKQNFGFAMRDGKPNIVIVDSGFKGDD